MLKQKFLIPVFKKILEFFSGHGLRKYKFLRTAKTIAISNLKSDFALVQGHKMYLGPKDSLQLSINGIYEELETEIVKKEVKNGDVVLDIGANIGYYTLIFAKLVGCNGKIFAFEPEPFNYDLLQKNIKINNYDNVTTEQKAVGNENDVIKLYLSKIRTGMHRIYKSKYTNDEFINVDIVKLDDYFKDSEFFNKINFIKMDVEGSEFGVLKGLTQILQNNDVKILAEFIPDSIREFGFNPKDFISFLHSFKYKIYCTDDESKKTIFLNDYEEIMSKFPHGTNLFCKKE